MSSIHATPDKAADVFAVVDLAGFLYQYGLFSAYPDAKKAADQMGMPSEIVRYSVPIAEDGEPCVECLGLIMKKYEKIATMDIRKSHRQDY